MDKELKVTSISYFNVKLTLEFLLLFLDF
jgi:hypothetical protein